ncbi:MAG TPA: serine/threonine protein kinase, partial [Chloroflexi bacterium]|nr:serine/threonine protein kinase [Chloroflexota bacterium]
MPHNGREGPTMIGQTLGNYRIVEQIGLGGMATVYKAYDPVMDRYVAIKVLPQQFSDDPQFRQRFQREARAIARLEHLHILPVFAYGEEGRTAYIVMRYLEAGTLTDRIAEGPLPFDEASRILGQLAGALDHAHGHGVLHRDVKPSNVLLDAAGNVYLMDFGIAKMVEATIDLTGEMMLGTPAYMSPEQCKGEPVTAASDIYSLGIVLYEMVTGRRPFHAETPIAVILQQLNDPLPPPRELRPDLPPQAENVIFKALAKDPESRYRSAGELAAAFARAVAEAEAAARPARPPAPPPSQ